MRWQPCKTHMVSTFNSHCTRFMAGRDTIWSVGGCVDRGCGEQLRGKVKKMSSGLLRTDGRTPQGIHYRCFLSPSGLDSKLPLLTLILCFFPLERRLSVQLAGSTLQTPSCSAGFILQHCSALLCGTVQPGSQNLHSTSALTIPMGANPSPHLFPLEGRVMLCKTLLMYSLYSLSKQNTLTISMPIMG